MANPQLKINKDGSCVIEFPKDSLQDIVSCVLQSAQTSAVKDLQGQIGELKKQLRQEVDIDLGEKTRFILEVNKKGWEAFATLNPFSSRRLQSRGFLERLKKGGCSAEVLP